METLFYYKGEYKTREEIMELKKKENNTQNNENDILKQILEKLTAVHGEIYELLQINKQIVKNTATIHRNIVALIKVIENENSTTNNKK